MSEETLVLIIDDDEAIRRTVRKILERAGHEVAEAADGRAGIRAARTRPPDVVITDIIMPDMEGMETIRRLKDELEGVKIVAMSGGGSLGPGGYLRDAQVLGADAAMPKPFTPSQLVALVEDLLED